MSNAGDFERALRKFQQEVNRTVERLGADTTAGELFNESFMRRYTDFSSFEAMVEAGQWGPATQETFRLIPEPEWEMWVRSRTRFPSWEQMQRKAGEELMAARLR